MTPEMEKAYQAFCKKRQLVYADGNRDVGWGDLSAAFFAAAAHEREACAKVAEQFDKVPTCEEYEHCSRIDDACDGIAGVIRARGV